MTAQRATNVKWNGNHIFKTDGLADHPEYGCLVATVIAGWAMTETQLGQAFATMIGTKQPVTLSMYSAVKSFEVQQELLRTAACEVLPKRYAMLFHAGLMALNQASHERHRFAHWVWGRSADPDLHALFLVEPKHFWQLEAARRKYFTDKRRKVTIERSGSVEFHFNQPRIEREHIFVYRLKDLQDAGDRIERAFRIAASLRGFVGADIPRRRAIYRTLCSWPDIQSALKKVKKNWPNRRPTRAEPRRRAPPKKPKAG